MKKFVSAVFILLLCTSIAFAAGAQEKEEVSIAVTWSGDELEAFKDTIAVFEENTGIDVVVESIGRDISTILTTRIQSGNPPDVSAIPNPGQMKEFAEKDALVKLDSSIVKDHPKAFVDLASVNGDVYGLFLSADLKSLVWYNPKEFEKQGYEVPETMEELEQLSKKIVADGGTPWCIGLESGSASGWPGTDWIEDIMLRTAGAEMYDKWVNHEIEWTHPAVKEAWELFGAITRNSETVYGGPKGALTTNFGDAPAAMFTDPPNAYMHRQATFIQSFIKNQHPDLVAGEDYQVFLFPKAKGQDAPPLLGAGDLVSVFNDTPQAMELAKFLASAEAQEIWAKKLGKLAVNTNVSMDIYPDLITKKAAEFLAEAEVFRFDGSDMMPSGVGSGSFWSGIMDYVNGEDLDKVLETIEKSADDAY
ncbi:MAG: ABC transporter substrate-binding protein [Spirochaetia bacterium]